MIGGDEVDGAAAKASAGEARAEAAGLALARSMRMSISGREASKSLRKLSWASYISWPKRVRSGAEASTAARTRASSVMT